MSFSCPAGTVVRDSELEMPPVSAASEGNDSKAANNKVTDRKIPVSYTHLTLPTKA